MSAFHRCGLSALIRSGFLDGMTSLLPRGPILVGVAVEALDGVEDSLGGRLGQSPGGADPICGIPDGDSRTFGREVVDVAGNPAGPPFHTKHVLRERDHLSDDELLRRLLAPNLKRAAR